MNNKLLTIALCTLFFISCKKPEIATAKVVANDGCGTIVFLQTDFVSSTDVSVPYYYRSVLNIRWKDNTTSYLTVNHSNPLAVGDNYCK